MTRKYQIINSKNEFVTRNNLTSDFSFTDNRNFAYIFTIDEAEQLQNYFKSFHNENVKIVDWKTYKVMV